MTLKDKVLDFVFKKYDDIAKAQAEDGRFLGPDGRYSTYNHSAGFYLAFVYTCNHPLNTHFRDPDALERAIRSWDFYSSITNEKGLTKLYTRDQYWGDFADEWEILYWMESIWLLKDCLSEVKLKQWNVKIHEGVSRLREYINEYTGKPDYREKLEKHHVSWNHFVWYLVCCYRYGMLYNDANVMENAAALLEDVISHQSAAGNWLENDTVVLVYSEVFFSAISLYEYYSKSPTAEKAIKKALEFTLNTIYPTLGKIECLDGRNRSHKYLGRYVAPTFCKYAEGVVYLSNWIANLENPAQITGKHAADIGAIAHMGSLMPEDAPYMPDDIRKYMHKITYYPEYKTKIIRRYCWIISFCGLEASWLDSRFTLHRQNLVSIYHEKTNVLIGGGHSISQPQFSSFNVITGGKSHYLHEEGGILHGADGLKAVCGGKPCRIGLAELTPEHVILQYSVEGLGETDRVYMNIPLVGEYGDVTTIEGEEIKWEDKHASVRIPAKSSIFFKGAEITISEDAVFNYPVFPYNQYSKKQTGNYEEVFGIITVELDYLKPKVLLRINIPSN